jgi:PilZ domain
VERDRRSAALNQPYSGFRRIACDEPCVIIDADGARDGIIWNLSVVGAYIVTSAPALPREGQQIQISFSLPQDPDPIKAVARVVWENRPSLWPGCGQRAAALPPGCGLEFIRLEAADRARIGARVRSAFPDPGRTPQAP